MRRVNLDRDEKPSLHATRCRSNKKRVEKEEKVNFEKQEQAINFDQDEVMALRSYGPPLPPLPQPRINKKEVEKHSIAP